MRFIITFLIAGCLSFVLTPSATAQSFEVAHDTVWLTTSGTTTTTFPDSIINLSASHVNIEWKVLATNFPADWRAASGFCDPALCYYDLYMWPTATTKTFGIAPGPDGFHLAIDFPSTTSYGCYYVQVKLNNQAIPTDMDTATFIICRPVPAGVRTVSQQNEVLLYPDPASTTVNVVYSAASHIKNIAIYNIIGKQVSNFKPTADNSASLNIENIPAGIYFVRFISDKGEVVTTRKFTRQ